jgi:DNA polymerase-3 subunit epsilon
VTIEAGIDTETTGLEYGDHRFVEIYIGLYRDEQLVAKFHTLIDPKRSIPAEAQRIHKITPADVAGKPDWETVAPKVQAFLAKADTHIAHNAGFDMPFIEYELKRAGILMPKRPVIDTMDYVWATPDGKKPSLKELCFACGVDYAETDQTGVGAHAADYDVDVMMQSLFAARRFGFAPPAIVPAQISQAA